MSDVTEPSRWERVARAQAGERYAEQYAARFADAAARGADVHGEADLLHRLAATGSVLDAGCGTGRVAVRLAELGHDVAGVDLDATMIDVARRDAPDLAWHVGDLATLDLGRRFDVVALPGNVVPFLEPADVDAAAGRLAAHLADGGLLVAGFGLDAAHLPAGIDPLPLTTWLEALAGVGLEERDRLAGWDGAPWNGGGYVVTVHAAAAGSARVGS